MNQYKSSPPAYEPNQGGQAYDFDERFKIERPRYNDVWASILFGVSCTAFMVLSVLGVVSFAKYDRSDNANLTLDFFNYKVFIMLAIDIGIVAALSFGMLSLMRRYAKQFIYIAAVFSVLLCVGTAVFMFMQRIIFAGIIALVAAGLQAFFFYSARNRIPFAAATLNLVIDYMKLLPSVYGISAIGVILNILFCAYFALSMVGFNIRKQPNGNYSDDSSIPIKSNGALIAVVVFLTFMAYWITEVIKNWTHASLCGAFGSIYYGKGQPGGIPKHSASASMKRASTISFGSICLGSLLASIVTFLKETCKSLSQSLADEGNIFLYILACIMTQIVAFLDWLVQMFNKYAYVEIALFGKKYMDAAKDTWNLIKDRGIDAVINDCLISSVMGSISLSIGIISAVVAVVFLRIAEDDVSFTNNVYIPLTIVLTVLVCLQVASTILQPISSGVATVFVCLAENPEVMKESDPMVFQEFVSVYPRIGQLGV